MGQLSLSWPSLAARRVGLVVGVHLVRVVRQVRTSASSMVARVSAWPAWSVRRIALVGPVCRGKVLSASVSASFSHFAFSRSVRLGLGGSN